MTKLEKEHIRISVVIPCYNNGNTLGRAVKSVQEQTIPVFEVIVVDDGSTDNTASIIKDCIGVTYIYQENTGPSAARNKGVRETKGNWVAFLDADDFWLPEKLAKQLSELEVNANTGLVFTGCKTVYHPTGRNRITIIDRLPDSSILFEKLLEGNFVTPCSSVIVNRDLFLSCGGFNEQQRFSEDWDLWLRLSRLTHFGYVPIPLVERHDHDGCACHNVLKMKNGKIQNVERHIGLIADISRRLHVRKSAIWSIHNSIGRALLNNGEISDAKKELWCAFKMMPRKYEIYYTLLKSFIPTSIYRTVRRILKLF